MKTPAKVAMILGIILLPVAGVVGLHLATREPPTDNGPGAAGAYTEIDWRLLRDLDYKTGEKPEKLAALDGKYVKIPGFVVPLDDDAASFAEFLLVPSPQACIHVPPPPPNQMIMVRMKSGIAPQRSWGPVWIKGRLLIASTDSQYGKISYMVHGDSSEPYRMEGEEPPKPAPKTNH